MKIFDVGPEAHGFIAIGQVATGFFALGQGATGVIAIGQIARGVIAVGQVAIGVVTVCQLGFGLLSCTAMLGIAGRWAKGIVLPLFPPAKDETGTPLPLPTPLATIRGGDVANGWIRAELAPHGSGVAVMHDGRPVDVELDAKITGEAGSLARQSWSAAMLRLRSEERVVDDSQRGYREAAPSEMVLVADELRPVPAPRWRESGFWLKLAGKTVVMLVLIGVYTFVGAQAILEGLLTIPD